MKKHEEIGSRLKIVLDTIGISQAEFARKADHHPPAVSNVVRGNQWPTPAMLVVLARDYGVSLSWLLAGVGPPLLPGTGGSTNIHAIIDRLMQVKPASAGRLLQFIEVMLDEGEEQESRVRSA